MDPIGLTLEGYDHYGRARTTEAGRAVEVSGALGGSGDQDGPLSGPKELGERLARASATHACVARRTFTYFTGREALAADACSLGKVEHAWRASGGSLVELITEVMASDAFLNRFAN
jgi:uncharacterized protein YbjT (DUF2867 family)